LRGGGVSIHDGKGAIGVGGEEQQGGGTEEVDVSDEAREVRSIDENAAWSALLALKFGSGLGLRVSW